MDINKYKKNKIKKKLTLNTKKMGVDIDKNEYYTIKETPENYPNEYYKK